MSTIEIKVAATENDTLKLAKEAISAHFAQFEGKKVLILSAARAVFASMGVERIKQTHLIGSIGFLVRMPRSEFHIEGDVEDDTIQAVLDYAGYDGIGVRGTRGVGLPLVSAVQPTSAAASVIAEASRAAQAPAPSPEEKKEEVVTVAAAQTVNAKANVQKGGRRAA